MSATPGAEGSRLQEAHEACAAHAASPEGRASGISPEAAQAVAEARELLEKAKSVTVLTGAGISTDSGIPDFRGPDGLWTKNPEAEAASTMQTFLTDLQARLACWQRVPLMFASVEPNAGHRALSSLRAAGKLRLLVTQNVDGLHRAAGQPEKELVEVHGSYARVQCLYCFTKHDTRKLVEEYRPPLDDAGRPAYEPRCPRCSGMLKPDVVLFGEALPEGVMEQALDAAESCDVLLCIGSTLAVSPVNHMVPQAKKAGARVVILNGAPTQMDKLADILIRAPISAALPAIIGCCGSPDVGASELTADPADSLDAANVCTPCWKDHGFDPWLPDKKMLAEMDGVVAQAWMSGVVPDWPPAVYHECNHPTFSRVGI